MADEPTDPKATAEGDEELSEVSDEDAEERTLVAAEAALSLLAGIVEEGLPIMFLSAVEEEDGDTERSLFTEIRGCHVAIKEQNKVLAKGVMTLGEIAASLKILANK